MAIELIDRYTRSLYNIINIDEVDIWQNVEFSLEQTDTDAIKSLFEQTYMYHEIGVETVSRFLDRLKAKVYELCLKYKPLLAVYNEEYTADDIYSNNQGTSSAVQKYYDTPQSQLDDIAQYLTNQQNVDVNESRLNGLTKAEARERYANSLRFLYHEFIKECKILFMEVF